MVLNTMGYGGVPEVAYRYLKHLPRDKYEPYLFILKPTPGGDRAHVARSELFDGLGLEITTASTGEGKFATLVELANWLSVKRIDLLHTHSYRPNLYARTAGAVCRPKGLKIIAHYHNQYDDKWQKNPPLLQMERELASCSDALIASSNAVRAHVAGRLMLDPQRLDVIYNGVDAERFQGIDRGQARLCLGIAGDRPAVGLVGRICEQKGQEDLVNAARILRARYPGILLFLIGDVEDKPLRDRLTAAIAESGLSENVVFTGHLDDMGRVYAALDVLVAPSRWEGFGLMLVEAMAAGTPIVASTAGAIPEVVAAGRCAVLVRPRDPAALARAVAHVLDNPARRKQLTQAGFERARDFTWPAAVRELERVYDRVLARSVGISACA